MSRLSVFGGALLLHRHHRARSELGLGAGRLHAGGEGLYRESDGAGHHMGRTDDGPEGARGQACHLRLRRSEERRGGVGDGAQEAAEVMGWDFRILDGQGSVPARTSALTQAIALNPDGIILGTIDAAEQAPIIEQAIAAGIKVVGWHAGEAPGKIDAVPDVFTNITTDPNEVAKASALYAVVDSGARRV